MTKENQSWYAVYTRSRAEKQLMVLLIEKGIEAYVPLHKVMRQWSDRKKLVEVPLIRSYCFVKVAPRDYQKVLNTPGAVRYVWFSGKPAEIPERQIDALKSITGSGIEVEVAPGFFQPGVQVVVTSGPLTGITGEMVSVANRKKLLVRIDHLNHVMMLSISPGMLKKVTDKDSEVAT